MATKGKSTGRLPKIKNETFDMSSIASSAVEEKLFGRADKEAEEDDDGPVVFICKKCRLPVGDSMSWDGSEEDQKQIKLKRVTNNVIIGKDSHLFEVNKRSVCLVVDLICCCCQSVLGMIYTATPSNLDHNRFIFYLSVASIDSYVLGSGGQMLAAEGPKEQLVTLEYRHNVEQQLTEMKMLVVSMAQQLDEIKADLKKGWDEP
ncbi:protein Mis18-alpha [Xiphophorus couchianus]|uniref:protein Mis18-alpha n=1 Tax=Xiphophorus couchianus TaxID=32473 RepID=UPI00101605D6|nr:protein Mis18-alpha [Xiphophorus couchianus]